MKKIGRLFGWIRQKRSRMVLALLLIILTAVFAFTRRGNNSSPQIQTATVEKGTIVSSINASGQILTSNITHITTQASGIVKKVYVVDGDYVTAGQTIAEIELDSEGLQNQASSYASYLSSRNSLENAENSLRSAQASLDVVYDEIKGHDNDETLEMKETRTKAEVARDSAYNSVENAKASLYSSWLSYSQTKSAIVAPYSGTINSIAIAEGLSLGSAESSSGNRSSQRVASIYKEGTPLASFNVSEIDVPQISVGQKATITIDSIPDKTFTGNVASVDRIGTTTSGVTNYPVLIKLDTESDEILPNMAASASIVTERKNDALYVPSSAIESQNGISSVRVIKEGVTQTVNVETGIVSDTDTEIVSGLTEGDTVITGTIQSSTQSTQGGSPFGGGFGGAVRFRQ